MNSGDYNRLVTIEAPTNARNEHDQYKGEHAPIGTMWVAIEPFTGKSYFAAQQAQSESNTKIRCRYKPDLRDNMRLRFGNILYEIETITIPKMRYEEMIIMCKEVII